MDLLVVGSMAFDDLETPFGKETNVVGGAATYIGYAASYCTDDIGVVSVVGGDFPQEVMDDLNSRGVDTEGVQIKVNEKSFFWSGRYHLDMNSRDTLDTQLNVLATFDPRVPETYRNAKYLLLGNLTPTVQQQVIEQMTTRPKLIAMDTMNFWMDAMPNELAHTISLVDMLLVNDEEARQLSGEYSLVKAAHKIQAMGPKYLVIKKGEHGALLFYKEQIFFAPALPLEDVFDPTGAGDTFAGGMLGYIAKKDDLSFETMKNALIYGSALASFCVEKFGTTRLKALMPSQIDQRLQEFSKLVSY